MKTPDMGEGWGARSTVKFLRYNKSSKHPCSRLVGREYIVETNDDILRCMACDYCEIEDTEARLEGVHAHCETPEHVSRAKALAEALKGTADSREDMLELFKNCPGLVGVEHIIVNKGQVTPGALGIVQVPGLRQGC